MFFLTALTVVPTTFLHTSQTRCSTAASTSALAEGVVDVGEYLVTRRTTVSLAKQTGLARKKTSCFIHICTFMYLTRYSGNGPFCRVGLENIGGPLFDMSSTRGTSTVKTPQVPLSQIAHEANPQNVLRKTHTHNASTTPATTKTADNVMYVMLYL